MGKVIDKLTYFSCALNTSGLCQRVVGSNSAKKIGLPLKILKVCHLPPVVLLPSVGEESLKSNSRELKKDAPGIKVELYCAHTL